MAKRQTYPLVRDEMMKNYYQAGTMARANKLHSFAIRQRRKQMGYNDDGNTSEVVNQKQEGNIVRKDIVKEKTDGKYELTENNKIDAYAKSKGFRKMNPSVYDGDTFYENNKSYRVKNVHAPEIANKHKGTPDKPKSREAKKQLEETSNNYTIYGKDTGERTYGRSVYEIMYGDKKNFMRMDSMMATDGFSMPATRFTTPELEKMKKGKW